MFLVSTAYASGLEAPSPTVKKSVAALIQKKLIKPLNKKERRRSMFSRAPMPAQERQVRVIKQGKDAQGRAFVTFAIDQRFGLGLDENAWEKDAWLGCTYLENGRIFVKVGDEYRRAKVLLGKSTDPAGAGTCEAGAGENAPDAQKVAQAEEPRT
jgi:hypothetical protein